MPGSVPDAKGRSPSAYQAISGTNNHDIPSSPKLGIVTKETSGRCRRGKLDLLKNLVKALVLRALPEPVSCRIRRVHYLRVLTSFPENEEPELKVVRSLVRQGDHAIDIGANIGVYTKYLSLYVGPTGRVHSIEPIARTFDVLKYNVHSLGLTNVHLLCFAISESSGLVNMMVPRDRLRGENLYESRITRGPAGAGDQETVRAETIDRLFSTGGTPICFVKCDVEGHEFECVKGALGVIDLWKPAWLIEVSGDPDNRTSSTGQLFDLFLERGYGPFWLQGSELRRRCPGERSVNYFFLTPEHLRLLQTSNLNVQSSSPLSP